MKKKIAMVICAVCLLTLTVSLMVGCGDKAEANPIIGTWIGTEQGEDWTRYFYAEIKKSTGQEYEKYDNWFAIDAKTVFTTGESKELTKSNDICYYSKTKKYECTGDFSPLPHFGDKWKYRYEFIMEGKDKFIVTGEEERGGSKIDVLYTFERTTLTLEQYQEQLKAA